MMWLMSTAQRSPHPGENRFALHEESWPLDLWKLPQQNCS